MGNNILVDTSVLIDLQREDENVVSHFSSNKDRVVISRVTAAEFIYGARDLKEKRVNKKFFTKMHIIDIDEEISMYAYTIIDRYGLKMKLGIADAFIAATAISKKLILWTQNQRHFRLIRELKLFEVEV